MTLRKIFIRPLALLLALTLLLALPSCADGEKKHTEITGFAFDTYYSFTLDPAVSLTPSEVSSSLARLESVLSAAKSSALLASFNQSEEEDLPLTDPDLSACLLRALSIAEMTDGAFDPTLGTLRELWQIKDGTAPIPTDDEINEALRNAGYRNVIVDQEARILTRAKPLHFDLGGIAKGYALSLLAEDARAADASYGILDFGGTVTVFGEKPDKTPFRIGIRSPYDPESYAGTVSLTPSAGRSLTVSVSGLYERYREADGVIYTHIFDPVSGYPLPAESSDPNALLSVAVIAADGATADALSTALLVMGERDARAFVKAHGESLSFSAILYGADGEVSVIGACDYTPTQAN